MVKIDVDPASLKRAIYQSEKALAYQIVDQGLTEEEMTELIESLGLLNIAFWKMKSDES